MSPAAPHRPLPFITRVRVDNYKSTAFCRRGSRPVHRAARSDAASKSDFLDALHFVRDALTNGPTEAVATRGGWEEASRH
ncbi:hypothetical protein ACFW95_41520 [Streptomyces sp. NPDC059474]|uniref:hypothetical protein n=1 Tax=Streptomyces sp. NPDC059474 TaxID=3346846 RepID=UPI0036C93DBA